MPEYDMRPSQIIALVATSEVAAGSRVERVYRSLRQAGVVDQRGRGRYAVPLGLEELSKVLIGSALPLSVEEATERVAALGALAFREAKLESHLSLSTGPTGDPIAIHLEALPAKIAHHLRCADGPIRSLAEIIRQASEHRVFARAPEYGFSGHFEPEHITSDITFIVSGGAALAKPSCQIRCVFQGVACVILTFGEIGDADASGFTKRGSRSVRVSVAIGADAIHSIASQVAPRRILGSLRQ